MNIRNVNLLVRFNKTRETFPRVTRILSILLTTAATSVSEERANSIEHVPKIPCLIRAASMRRGAAITQLMSKCL